MPAEQLPGAEYVRRCVDDAQSAAGGELQVTVAHGSGLHWLLLQPKGHTVSVGV